MPPRPAYRRRNLATRGESESALSPAVRRAAYARRVMTLHASRTDARGPAGTRARRRTRAESRLRPPDAPHRLRVRDSQAGALEVALTARAERRLARHEFASGARGGVDSRTDQCALEAAAAEVWQCRRTREIADAAFERECGRRDHPCLGLGEI